MKNFLKLIGILALITAIGFSMAACDDPDEGEIIDPGKLTIVGFDVQNEGWLVEAEKFEEAVEADDTKDPPIEAAEAFFLFAASSYKEKTKEVTPGEIKNRRVSMNVWISKGGEPVIYKGNDEKVDFTVILFHPTDLTATPVEGTVEITFKNGVGIGEFVPNP